MASSAVVMETMGVATQCMSAVNKMTGGPQHMQQTVSEYAREMEKMSLSDDMWGDLIDEFDGE
jgi:hypothetical protein